jgi:hypothetical protein
LPVIFVKFIFPLILIIIAVSLLSKVFTGIQGLFIKPKPEIPDASGQVIEVDAQVIE